MNLDGELAMMGDVGLPSGTLTFLLSDVEGSTALWEAAREPMAVALPRSLEIVEKVASAHGGVLPVEQGEGDSRLAVFHRAADALAAALTIQRSMTDEAWPEGAALRVRIAVHAGDARLRDERTYGGGVVHRAARLRALARGGQVLVSRAVHDLVADELPAGMELADLGHHRLRDLSRPEQVFELRHPDLAIVEGGLRSLDAVPNNLPSAVSSFVGRIDERAELGGLLAGHRLVTVTGPGGCGKTRLALEVAADAAADRPDGIWLVELSGVADPDLIPDTILAAVDVGEAAGVDAIDRLSTFLQSRRALIVLDTCEHLIEAAADAAHRLLQACPKLSVVATSREPLGLTGELVWRVPPMTVGDRGEGDAGALFAERAAAARSNFRLTEENRDTVSAVCRRLDGIPLAIELAAARVRSLALRDIAAGLDDRFRLLGAGTRTGLARQRTLEASVQWSYELTDPVERTVLRRLAAFQGSFDLPAAERVAGWGDVDELAILDVLGRLVDKSLVQMEESRSGETRYGLLDTIRHFGRDRLTEAGEVAETLTRHLGWIRDFAEEAEPVLHRGDLAVLARIDDHIDDIRSALGWACADHQRAAAAVGIVGALGFYWLLRGRFREGIEWCRRALEAAPDDPADAERLRARWALVDALFYGSDPADALDLAAVLAEDAAAAGLRVFEARCRALAGLALGYEGPAGLVESDRAVALADEAGDEFTRIDNYQCRAYVYLWHGNLAAAAADFAAVQEAAQRSGNAFHVGWDGGGRGWLAVIGGDPAAAIVAARNGQAAARRAGETNSDAIATLALCWALADSGRPDDALREVDEGDELFARRPGQLNEVCMAAARAYVLASIGDDAGAAASARHCTDRAREGGITFALLLGLHTSAVALRRAGDLGGAGAVLVEAEALIAAGHGLLIADTAVERARLWRAAGDPDRAEDGAHAALVIAMEKGFRRAALLALEELAYVTAAAGAGPEAARLLGACRSVRRAMNGVRSPEEQRWTDDATAIVHKALGEAAAAALADGEQLSLDEAVAYARRSRGERGRPAAGWGSLTPTERQVVDLVAEGLTNPQIGERLLMSRATVKAHLAHVFIKLGVASRTELATVATRHMA